MESQVVVEYIVHDFNTDLVALRQTQTVGNFIGITQLGAQVLDETSRQLIVWVLVDTLTQYFKDALRFRVLLKVLLGKVQSLADSLDLAEELV